MADFRPPEPQPTAKTAPWVIRYKYPLLLFNESILARGQNTTNVTNLLSLGSDPPNLHQPPATRVQKVSNGSQVLPLDDYWLVYLPLEND